MLLIFEYVDGESSQQPSWRLYPWSRDQLSPSILDRACMVIDIDTDDASGRITVEVIKNRFGSTGLISIATEPAKEPKQESGMTESEYPTSEEFDAMADAVRDDSLGAGEVDKLKPLHDEEIDEWEAVARMDIERDGCGRESRGNAVMVMRLIIALRAAQLVRDAVSDAADNNRELVVNQQQTIKSEHLNKRMRITVLEAELDELNAENQTALEAAKRCCGVRDAAIEKSVTLETERDELAKQLQELKRGLRDNGTDFELAFLDAYLDKFNQLLKDRAERDELRAELTELTEERDVVMQDYQEEARLHEKTAEERDKLRDYSKRVIVNNKDAKRQIDEELVRLHKRFAEPLSFVPNLERIKRLQAISCRDNWHPDFVDWLVAEVERLREQSKVVLDHSVISWIEADDNNRLRARISRIVGDCEDVYSELGLGNHDPGDPPAVDAVRELKSQLAECRKALENAPSPEHCLIVFEGNDVCAVPPEELEALQDALARLDKEPTDDV